MPAPEIVTSGPVVGAGAGAIVFGAGCRVGDGEKTGLGEGEGDGLGSGEGLGSGDGAGEGTGEGDGPGSTLTTRGSSFVTSAATGTAVKAARIATSGQPM
jgi:hypothetical protein